jgi:hypothetical protein
MGLGRFGSEKDHSTSMKDGARQRRHKARRENAVCGRRTDEGKAARRAEKATRRRRGLRTERREGRPGRAQTTDVGRPFSPTRCPPRRRLSGSRPRPRSPLGGKLGAEHRHGSFVQLALFLGGLRYSLLARTAIRSTVWYENF